MATIDFLGDVSSVVLILFPFLFSMCLLLVFSPCQRDPVARNHYTYLELLSNVEQADEGTFHMNVRLYSL